MCELVCQFNNLFPLGCAGDNIIERLSKLVSYGFYVGLLCCVNHALANLCG
jgi:hypothetical protein